MPRQASIQAVAWIFLVAFGQIYNKNVGEKTEQKNI